MADTLVAYFSRAGNNYVNGEIVDLPVGNTKIAAQIIAEQTGGDLFEIRSIEDYPADYKECVAVAVKQLKESARPKLADPLSDIAGYRTIYLGYPNWCGTMPLPVYTFLESYDFAGKTIRPFCTNEGSGLSKSEGDIARLCPSAEVTPGLSIHGAEAADAGPAIARWIG